MANAPIQLPGASSVMTYRIAITGSLTGYWADWFNGMVVAIDLPKEDRKDTTLTVCVPDQAALRSILNKLWDLNRTLVAVAIVSPEECRGSQALIRAEDEGEE